MREAAIFQLKLLADGIRDAILIPFSLLAALIGLAAGGKNCDEKFRRVVTLGRRSEQWINLFGQQSPSDMTLDQPEAQHDRGDRCETRDEPSGVEYRR